MPKRVLTYLDANVLIAAHRGKQAESVLARMVIAAPNRAFIVSDYLFLETAAYAYRRKSKDEYNAILEFFNRAYKYVQPSHSVVRRAFNEIVEFNGQVIDMCHVAAAKAGGAQELITTEDDSKPMFGAKGIRVVNLFDL